jgi:hypothetical protein
MKILQTAPCDAVFLGDRNYLHSTTMIPALLDTCSQRFGLGAIKQVSAQFHALTDRQCRFELLEVPAGVSLTQLGYVATFKVSGEKAEGVVGLRPGDAVIAHRHAFDEDGLITGYTLDQQAQTITLAGMRGEVLPTIVSLNKRLHSTLFASTGFGKWLLTRLDLGPAYFNTPSPQAISLQIVAILASVNSKATIFSEEGLSSRGIAEPGRAESRSAERVALGSVHFSRKKETT